MHPSVKQASRKGKVKVLMLALCALLCLQVSKVQGEATDMWQKMANAEQGSAVHKLYK
jgi:hypothetical protein